MFVAAWAGVTPSPAIALIGRHMSAAAMVAAARVLAV
jgi:hypothetical protein